MRKTSEIANENGIRKASNVNDFQKPVINKKARSKNANNNK